MGAVAVIVAGFCLGIIAFYLVEWYGRRNNGNRK